MEPWQPLRGGLFKHQIKGNELSVQFLSRTGAYYTTLDEPLNIDCLARDNAREFNPHLDTTNGVIKDTLVDCFKRCSGDELTVEESKEPVLLNDAEPDEWGERPIVMRLTIETMFYEMKFRWKLNIPEASNTFQQGVVNPFLNTIQLLLKQQKLLEKTLKKKDAEISEFRSLGVKLSKKSVLSPPYDPKMITLLKLDSEQSLSTSLSDPALQEVFCRAAAREEKVEKVKSKSKVVKMGVRFSDDEEEEEDSIEGIKKEEAESGGKAGVGDNQVKEEPEEELHQVKVEPEERPVFKKKRKKRSL